MTDPSPPTQRSGGQCECEKLKELVKLADEIQERAQHHLGHFCRDHDRQLDASLMAYRWARLLVEIDPEILGLCDVLNEKGFPTIGSCAGHGCWPFVVISGDIPDAKAESLLRYLRPLAVGYLPRVQKEIEPKGHYWYLELQPHNLFKDTPTKEEWIRKCQAIEHVVVLLRGMDEP